MDALFDQAVFSVGGEGYRWEDVVSAAKRWGDWDRLRDRAREGLACLARLDEEEEEIAAEEIESAADEFRYARDLVSAQEMEEWLGRWSLTAEDWMDWIRSCTLRQKGSEELADLLAEYAPDEEDVENFTRTEAVCSGELEKLAHKLAGMAAIDRKETAPEQESQGADRLERLEASYRSFRQRVLNPAMIDREIRFHRTEWTRLDCRRVVFAEEEKAREAALCIREDGSALDDVASGAGAGVETQTVFLEEIEPQLHDHFLGARKGDLVGPLKQGEEFSLYLVMEKVLPSEKEAADVERAEQNILNRLVEREINERVKWAALPRVNA